MFVYQVSEDSIERIFGIETGRELGSKRVQGLVQFIPAPGGKSFDVLAAPGRATGWTAKTYPWAQDAPGSGSIEPVLLPWGGIGSVRYHWSRIAVREGVIIREPRRTRAASRGQLARLRPRRRALFTASRGGASAGCPRDPTASSP